VPDRVSNNGALGFFDDGCPINKMSSDVRSVPDLKTECVTSIQIVTGIEVNGEIYFPRLTEYCLLPKCRRHAAQ